MKYIVLFFCPLLFLNCENQAKQQLKIEYFPNGAVSIEAEVNSNGDYNGNVIAYFENGEIGAKLSYIDGLMNGTNYWYHQNGVIKLFTIYKDHKKLYSETYDTLGNFVSETRKIHYKQTKDTVEINEPFEVVFKLMYNDLCDSALLAISEPIIDGKEREKAFYFHKKGLFKETVLFRDSIKKEGDFYYNAGVFINCNDIDSIRSGTIPIKITVVKNYKSKENDDFIEANVPFYRRKKSPVERRLSK